jgi:hypothetical protein
MLVKSEQVHGAFGFTGELDGPEQQVVGNGREQKRQVMVPCWAESRASTNTHMGMSYVRYSCRRGPGAFAMLLQGIELRMRPEERREVGTWIVCAGTE